MPRLDGRDYGRSTFQKSQQMENEGMKPIRQYLRFFDSTVDVLEATVQQQKEDDIDLIWVRNQNGEITSTTIEVKVDYIGHKTNNFAFELVSSEFHMTLGCFMKTKSDLFFYYLHETQQLYIMNTEQVRNWFIEEQSKRPFSPNGFRRFKEFGTHTEIPNVGFYCSLGHLVPIWEVEQGLGANLYHRDLKKMLAGSTFEDF